MLRPRFFSLLLRLLLLPSLPWLPKLLFRFFFADDDDDDATDLELDRGDEGGLRWKSAIFFCAC